MRLLRRTFDLVKKAVNCRLGDVSCLCRDLWDQDARSPIHRVVPARNESPFPDAVPKLVGKRADISLPWPVMDQGVSQFEQASQAVVPDECSHVTAAMLANDDLDHLVRTR